MKGNSAAEQHPKSSSCSSSSSCSNEPEKLRSKTELSKLVYRVRESASGVAQQFEDDDEHEDEIKALAKERDSEGR